MAITVSKMAMTNSISSLGGAANTITVVDSSIARKLDDVKTGTSASRTLLDASLLAAKKIPLMLSVTRASLYADSGDFKVIKNASSSDGSREQYSVGSNPIRLQLVSVVSLPLSSISLPLSLGLFESVQHKSAHYYTELSKSKLHPNCSYR